MLNHFYLAVHEARRRYAGTFHAAQIFFLSSRILVSSEKSTLRTFFSRGCLSRNHVCASRDIHSRRLRKVEREETGVEHRSQYRNEDRPWMGPRRSSYQFALPCTFCELRHVHVTLTTVIWHQHMRARDVHFTLYCTNLFLSKS